MKTRKWNYLMPMTILLIGILSVALLFGVYRIRVYQHINSVLNNTILHVEVNTAIFHMQIEEFISGDTTVNITDAIARMDKSIKLAEAISYGGPIDSEQESLSGMVKMLGLQAQAEEMTSLLKSFKNLALWRLQSSRERGIGSDSDQQFDAMFNQILEKTVIIENVCKTNRDDYLLKSKRIVHGIYLLWAFVMVSATTVIWRIEVQRKRAEEALLESNSLLLSQAEELAAHRENLAGLVEQRTSELTAANERLRFEITERLQVEETLRESDKQIRQLSAELLMAQEIERKRISMELHDSLGQALNVMKLRIRLIEKGMDESQEAARGDCESLLEYLDDVIEEVRRLSLDLSPAILEDLGLASALRWLVSNFRKSHSLKATADIAEIDALFPENHRITIYRVIQEALTNVGKHAGASNVSIGIRRHDDQVTFSVEDDGNGFDPQDISSRKASERGVGLTTMSERVRMVGGVFGLWSRAGEGTRITFSLPVVNGGT
ncbi:MAG: sensor histidine kinase [Steroidobacteraceae bacterium]|nr:sensor histidine kinase [Deltaproteobacteria bacterium]